MKGVSNCYSIGKDADMMSANVERIARENRWLSPDEPFDFAKAYSGRQVGQPAGNAAAAKRILADVTATCTEQFFLIAKAESIRLAERIKSLGGLYGRQKEELEKYAAYAEMPLL